MSTLDLRDSLLMPTVDWVLLFSRSILSLSYYRNSDFIDNLYLLLNSAFQFYLEDVLVFKPVPIGYVRAYGTQAQ